ncbi:hypothetical protein [Geodermatophilus sp. DSM 45219]|uniref:hypothetical protein n=1 Tax=Geodermatophilus sp. DSM 45219 TaxID=1881103 RepID=UPI00115FA99C|nr:hypothetical protein [Geodermatophilus sp. DSM 45219]
MLSPAPVACWASLLVMAGIAEEGASSRGWGSQSGADLAEVVRRAGHSSSRAAMTHQHAAERRDAEVAARLGRLAAGTRATCSAGHPSPELLG